MKKKERDEKENEENYSKSEEENSKQAPGKKKIIFRFLVIFRRYITNGIRIVTKNKKKN